MHICAVLAVMVMGYGPWVSTGPEGGDLDAPVQSPSDPDELWALSGYNPTTVVHSVDGGASWEVVSSFTGSSVYDMKILSDGHLVAAGSSRTWTSTDGGVTWTGNYQSNTIFYHLAAHSTDPDLVYAAGYAYDGSWKAALMQSTDGGNSFSIDFLPLGPGYTQSYGRCVAVSESNPSVILVGGYGYDGSYDPFVMKSTDGGATFTDVTPPAASSQYYFYGAAIHPSNPDVMLAGSLYSMYRTTDGGGSWTAVASQTYNYDISYHPMDPSMVAAAGMNRIYLSSDGGVSWSSVYTPFSGASGMQWIIPDHSSLSKYYTASSAGFYRSLDGGVSWTQSNTGLIIGRVLAMEESQGWMFMNMQDMGVFRTPSSGPFAWEEVTTPLSCGDFCDICADGAGTLLALEGSG